MKPLLFLFTAAVLSAQTYDLVVYGGTAGGAITAVSGARSGLKVALVEPRNHIGGMVSGGLSQTDVGQREVIGGYSLEFYARAGAYYNLPQYLQDIAWYVEPKVAETIFRQMLAGGRRHRHLQSPPAGEGRRPQGRRRASPPSRWRMATSFTARIFADCTYEGDLMAQAGVSYTWGRESAAQYGESLAGVRSETPYHQFLVNISPYAEGRKLLPKFQQSRPASRRRPTARCRPTTSA